MTNKEITKVIFNNAEISALYYGDVLFWKKGNTAEYDIYGEIEQNPQHKVSKVIFNPVSFVNGIDIPINSDNSFSYKLKDGEYFKGGNKIFNIVSDDNYSMEQVLTKLDISNLSFDRCTSLTSFLYNCTNLRSLIGLEHINTENCTDMRFMFYSCYLLSSIDVSNFNTSNVTDMTGMFNNCRALTTLNVSNFNTSNVTNMTGMFLGCNKLTTLDLSSFNTANCTNMNSMFGNDYGRRNILNRINFGTNFNTSNVTNMYNMFYNSTSLTTVTGVFEGTKVDLDLHYSPLTNASAMVFINGLANVEETKKITFKTSTYNTLTEEQIAVATSKGWTVISA